MITHNQINPKCYLVSKVDDTTPVGLIQLTLKQDEYDPKRDNPELLICDYYNDTGDIAVTKPKEHEEPIHSVISYLVINEDGELEKATAPDTYSVGEMYYFSVDFAGAQWRVEVDGDYDEQTRQTLERLISIRKVDDSTISLKPGKSNKIKGLTFKLTVCDVTDDHESSIKLEVAE